MSIGHKAHNREVSKANWRMIARRLSEKAVVGKNIGLKYASREVS
ncbi:MAG: hypothetical protein QXI97_03590 [Nitrososphaerota archaeon]